MTNRRALTTWLALAALIASSGAVLAQQQAEILVGEWTGTIQLPASALGVQVNFSQAEDGSLSGSIDIPEQNANAVPLENISAGDSLQFSIAGIPGQPTFLGSLSPDGNRISGWFTQGGQRFRFELLGEGAMDTAPDVAAQVPSAPAPSLADRIDLLRSRIPAVMEALNVPGLALGIVKDGEVLLEEGYGYADIDASKQVESSTLFAIGSATKAFTGTLLSMLADDGSVDWEAPVSAYLPEFEMMDEVATQKMTVIDLLTHRSGLPRHDAVWYNSPLSRAELISRLKYLEPTADIRTRFQYQNLMFMTAGHVAEKIADRPWESLIQDKIFRELGMSASNTSVRETQRTSNYAKPYVHESETREIPFRNIDNVGPAGSINSSVSDMLRWLEYNASGGLLDGRRISQKAVLAKTHEPHMIVSGSSLDGETPFTLYGLGWFVQPYRGRILIQHGGNIDGFSAMAAFMPDENVGVVVLTNLGSSPAPGVVTRMAYDQLLGLEEIDWLARAESQQQSGVPNEKWAEIDRKPDTTPTFELAEYVGEYTHPGYGIVTVKSQRDRLVASFNGMSADLEHWHYDVFRGADFPGGYANLRFHFKSNTKGDVVAVELPLEPMVDPIPFEKSPPEELSDPRFLESLTGDYLVEDIQPLKIKMVDGSLTAELPGQPSFTLVPYRGTEFIIKNMSGFSVRFMVEGDSVEEVVLVQPNGTFVAKPV